MDTCSRVIGLRRLASRRRRLHFFCLCIFVAYIIDMIAHHAFLRVSKPQSPLDSPFAVGCIPRVDRQRQGKQDTPIIGDQFAKLRQNATILIVARNQDVDGVVSSLQSLEKQWIQVYHYPILLLNNEAWDPQVTTAIQTATQSETTFAAIPEEHWSWPDGVIKDNATAIWNQMEASGIPYVSEERYHHMCRFFSGFFFDNPALQEYRYFWCVEPNVEFTCHIPYDPFELMHKNGKVYGYTIALWEVGTTCPSLMRVTSDFKEEHGVINTPLWNSMLSPNWMPLPLRWIQSKLHSVFHSRTRDADEWNYCHFWSNFEIADMDFFRSIHYRAYFDALEKAGGFYYERWGDAPVHSLALAMFTQPDQIHYFEDIGYSHPPFQHCPPAEIGCDCFCDADIGRVPRTCLDKMRRGQGR